MTVPKKGGKGIPTPLNQNIKMLRTVLGITQEDLAKYLSINVNSIKNYENIAVEPKAKTMLLLSKLSGISSERLSVDVISFFEISRSISRLQTSFADFFQSYPDSAPTDIGYIERDMHRYPDSVEGDRNFYYDIVRPLVKDYVRPSQKSTIDTVKILEAVKKIKKEVSPSPPKVLPPLSEDEEKARKLASVLVQKWNAKNKAAAKKMFRMDGDGDREGIIKPGDDVP